ncbi:MAG: MarR family winged helix-turn-helix transcriptional regulator [Pseudohongiellaceae bacterium]|nr:MarR family winged helix-turn-helix transcriptional regulator [Pseudohongiellaceae bacterium]
MSTLNIPCYAFSTRQASRRLSQFYEHRIISTGVHAQQFTILAIIEHKASISLTELAEELGMDRTTLARNLKPMERDELLTITPSKEDGRIKVIALTSIGKRKLKAARKKWQQAQADFEDKFGAERARKLREELKAAAQAASL